jgi:uncharacterized damage-inducible protein DinB
MLTANALAEAFHRNVRIAQIECEGLTHAESLLQPQPRGNCMNWVLGHMVTGRNDVLYALKSPFVVEDEVLTLYKRESDPITEDIEGVLQLERLLELLVEGQRYISDLLPSLSEESLMEEYVSKVTGRSTTIAKLVFFQYFHDTYHTGQTSYLRQLAGKDDKII